MPDEMYFDKSFEPDKATIDAFSEFVAVIRQLRRDCPWDREQTHESVKHLLIEEAYETLEAIESGDAEELTKELGDILLHVVFHAAIGEGDDRFELRDVIVRETEKLVRRHPHVFAETEVSGTGEVLRNWEEIKMAEGGRRSVLDGVPVSLPSLLRAYRIQEKAAGVGFDFPERVGAWEKVDEEIAEFRSLVEGGSPVDASEKEFGDLLFALVNYARLAGINPENALRYTNDKFARRFSHIERRLKDRGESVADSTLEAMDLLWDEAKSIETNAERGAAE
jgi:MazG family protein